MMNRTLTFLVFCVMVACLCDCRSAPPAPKPVPVAGISKAGSPMHPAKAIEHKESATGGQIPAWVLLEPEQISRLPEYVDAHVYIYRQDAADLESLLAWSRGFPAATEVARAITDGMTGRFAAGEYAQKDLVSGYLAGAVKIVSAAEYAGMLRRGDFWIHLQLYDDKGKPAERVYRYLLLYTVPRAQVTAAMQRALREQDRTFDAATAEVQAARDWVNSLFAEGL
jgi:hypothetical protein